MKINKVLLLSLPAYTTKNRDINPLPPIGIGYLASALESINIRVKIYDALMMGWNHEEKAYNGRIRVGSSDDEIQKIIKEYSPDAICLNFQFSKQHRLYHHMLKLIKEVNPNIITIAGGAHTTVCPEEVLSDANCDYIILGEGEETIKELIISINENKDISSIDGFGYKNKGILIINPKTKWIDNLDSLRYPAYGLMELERYFGLKKSHGNRHKSKFSPIITSRGCPAKCTFCTANKVWGNKYRTRSVDDIIGEMRMLKYGYGVEEIMFEDDNITADYNRAKELFSRMIEEKFNFIWDTPNGVGVWNIDNDLIDLMKASGCVNLNFPIESGSKRVLHQIIKKPLNLEKVKSLIKHCDEIGLSYSIFLVIGLPGESLEEMWESIKFSARVKCYHPHISVFTPYPGSKLTDECKENGYISRNYLLDNLFIRGFMVKTEAWNERDIKIMILKSIIYLNIKSIVNKMKKIFLWQKSYF